ncbi:winged helix-turn-helix domain-containing protein [Leptolyngbya sp. FACHB-541]|uniref:winged helix-turn-helix domain-containing protein n=1 Tax=Leptolyngbya sp. FACHB-541 TaxID=2692810 RepID=UPI001686246D|nr:winged helix-turn-helix domain-containing protein [Leptolyngbya sp. FACHB-541]MBD1996863.1 winged helix-turn-helix domain-containing protein [Leptolyngbya sp. FACHB-541]
MSNIRTRDVLQSVLLQTLKRFRDGLQIRIVYEEIECNFTFPQEWLREIPSGTGYDELEKRGVNWRDIPQEQLVQMVRTEPQWQNEIRWARNDLRKSGYLDISAPRGVWKLTEQGHHAAGTTLQNLTSAEKQVATPKPQLKIAETPSQKHLVLEPGLSSREALERKLALLTSSMPLDDLDLLVDIARSIRLRSIGE